MRNFLIVLFFTLLTCGSVFADSYADERFKGGGYDGYDRSTYWFPDPDPLQYALIRYTGGWYDGYTRCMVTNLTISVRGTIIIRR